PFHVTSFDIALDQRHRADKEMSENEDHRHEERNPCNPPGNTEAHPEAECDEQCSQRETIENEKTAKSHITNELAAKIEITGETPLMPNLIFLPVFHQKMTEKNDWFRDWFGSPYYRILYRNRDEQEARAFVARLCAHL